MFLDNIIQKKNRQPLTSSPRKAAFDFQLNIKKISLNIEKKSTLAVARNVTKYCFLGKVGSIVHHLSNKAARYFIIIINQLLLETKKNRKDSIYQTKRANVVTWLYNLQPLFFPQKIIFC